jgi:hypothetical protein
MKTSRLLNLKQAAAVTLGRTSLSGTMAAVAVALWLVDDCAAMAQSQNTQATYLSPSNTKRPHVMGPTPTTVGGSPSWAVGRSPLCQKKLHEDSMESKELASLVHSLRDTYTDVVPEAVCQADRRLLILNRDVSGLISNVAFCGTSPPSLGEALKREGDTLESVLQRYCFGKGYGTLPKSALD